MAAVGCGLGLWARAVAIAWLAIVANLLDRLGRALLVGGDEERLPHLRFSARARHIGLISEHVRV